MLEVVVVVKLNDGWAKNGKNDEDDNDDGQEKLRDISLIIEGVGLLETLDFLNLVLRLVFINELVLIQIKTVLLIYIYLFDKFSAGVVHLSY